MYLNYHFLTIFIAFFFLIYILIFYFVGKNRELQIMRVVHHPNIVDLKAFFYSTTSRDQVYLNLIQEFVPETVYEALHSYTRQRMTMPEFEVKLYTYQLFRALAYIHSMGICHRDIKPQNLLVNPNTGILKLIDFGSAKVLNPNEPNVSYICSRYYRAPELIFGAVNYQTCIDVWSAGCVMGELMLGQPLFPGESGIDQLVEIIKILGTPTREQIRTMNPTYMDHRFPQIRALPFTRVFRQASNDAIDFITKVLEYSPNIRLSPLKAMCHKYFDELRNESTKLRDFNNLNGNSNNNGLIRNQNHQQQELRNLPPLFNFNKHELSIEPELNFFLVPEHERENLLRNEGIDLNNFIPIPVDELKVTLD